MDCHLITCEFPPCRGGVADFTHALGEGLAAAGKTVHVWAPAPAHVGAGARLRVHALDDGYRATSLPSLSRALDACPGPRRLIVQWVPHGYGYKSLNLPFCVWVAARARHGDSIELMIHEPFLPFDAGRFRQNLGALVHRGMLMLLLRAADRVWVSTPSFIGMVAPWGRRGAEPIQWMPVSSPVRPVRAPEAVAARRAGLAGSAPLVGYFGTCNPLVAPRLRAALEQLVSLRPDVHVLLLGRGTAEFARALPVGSPVAARLVGSGEHEAGELSVLMQCCDVFLQPYPDGISARRTTAMALLEHGLPMITSQGPRTEPCWAESAAVRLVPSGHAEAMAGEAVALLENTPQRAGIGARARRMYREHFRIELAVAALCRRQPEAAGEVAVAASAGQ